MQTSRLTSQPEMAFSDYEAAVRRADDATKKNNGHQYMMNGPKERCMWCGSSRKRVRRCGGWFRTFLWQLAGELTGTHGLPRGHEITEV